MNVFKLFLKSLAGTTFFLIILFISAGRINYWQGLLYAAINFISVGLTSFALANNQELAEERSKPGAGVKSWDKVILGTSALTLIIIYIVAGLDSGRFHWSPELPWSICLPGTALLFFGEFLFITAQKQNKFFSSVMRIQSDRGHVICDTGLCIL